MGDRIAVMRDGEIVQVDTPGAIYDRPATVFVGSFIGSPPMNFLRCVARDGAAVGEGFAVPAPPGMGGKTLLLGIRPENIRLVAASVAPDGSLLSMISYDREHGLAELTSHPPFDESKRFEQTAVRAYRATLAHPSAPGFGVRPDLDGEWRVELLGAAVPRSTL